MVQQHREVGDDLLNRAIEHVEKLADNVDNELLFHDFSHILDRDKGIQKIGLESGLGIHDLLPIRLVGLFTDIKYWRSASQPYNPRKQLKLFIAEEKLDERLKKKVAQLMSYAESGHDPADVYECVFSDAGNMHKVEKGFISKLPLLKKEMEIVSKQRSSDLEWYGECDRQLQLLKFHTEYGKKHFQLGVEEVRKEIKKRLKKIERKTDELLQKDLRIDELQLKELKKKLRKAEGLPDRGIETLFRLVSGNHFSLNAMVDKKSSILISINSIILSIVIGTVLKELEQDPHLLVPLIMISITNLWSISLAVFATRPEDTHGGRLGGDVAYHGSNLMFYGNFHHMSEGDYLKGMEDLMSSRKRLYGSIARDVYYLGINLNRKFRLLRRSFNIFVFGFILSVITFIACHLFFGNESLFASY